MIDLKYLYFYLKKSRKKIETLGTGSTFKAITKQQLNTIKNAKNCMEIEMFAYFKNSKKEDIKRFIS